MKYKKGGKKHMSNIMAAKAGFNMSKEVESPIKNGGKYGCVALGIVALYDLCVKAIEKGYAFNINFDPEGKVSINFTPLKSTV